MPFRASLFFVILSFLVQIFAKITPEVDLGYARYVGTYNATTETTKFLGIRYAAPPTGDLRWQEPKAPPITTKVQKADTQPAGCYVGNRGGAPTTPFHNKKLTKRSPFFPSEDCLFLNVYRPGHLSNDHQVLPVIVWIHGGGYASGGVNGYHGDDLIRASNGGVVVVVIQYRLGLFGFLPGNEVKKNGALNAGLLDQQFALRWVQKHIHKFGGDPARVTIWGVSAGAGSVLQHIIANDGNTTPPLFRGAITSSSFLPSQYHYNDRIPEILFHETVAQANCSDARDRLACLREVDVKTLQRINDKISQSGFYGSFVFVPVVDGTFIRQRPIEALRQRKVNGDMLLSVTNTHEGTIFIDPKTSPHVTVSEYVEQLFPNFGPEEAAAAAAQYRDLGSHLFQVQAIIGEAVFICPTYYLLEAFNGHAFKSEFAISPGSHGSDVPYYFPSIRTPPYNNTAFHKMFSESFLNFAMSLNPNTKCHSCDITPKWKVWALGETEMLFNKTKAGEPDIRPVVTSKGLLKRCHDEYTQVLAQRRHLNWSVTEISLGDALLPEIIATS